MGLLMNYYKPYSLVMLSIKLIFNPILLSGKSSYLLLIYKLNETIYIAFQLMVKSQASFGNTKTYFYRQKGRR